MDRLSGTPVKMSQLRQFPIFGETIENQKSFLKIIALRSDSWIGVDRKSDRPYQHHHEEMEGIARQIIMD
jgi:hypothetical protein